MNQIIIRPEASDDLVDAVRYCARGGRSAALRFVEAVEGRFEFLRCNPLAGPLVHGEFRRLLIVGYPFGIFYRVTKQSVIVKGVLDLRRDPNRIYGALDYRNLAE